MSYKQHVLGSTLSIQQGTTCVPDDNRYYLLDGTVIIQSYRFLKDAKTAFKEALEARGWQPPKAEEKLSPEELVQRERTWMEYYRSEEFISNSHKFTSGGKLRNR